MNKAIILLALLAACGKEGQGGGAAGAGGAIEITGEMSTAAYRDFDPADVARGGRAILPLLSDVDSFNPYLSTSVDADEVHGLLWPLPLQERADYHKGPPSFAPRLVDRWEVKGKTIAMHIREDAVWSDGVPVTSKDVEFSARAAKDPDVAWPNSSILDQITRVEIVDDKNYLLHYSEEYPYMLMDSKDWRIIPSHVFGKIPFNRWKGYPDWDKVAHVVSGPYKVESYKHNEEFVLVPNDRYWDKELPRISRVVFRVINSQQTQFDALLSGGIDAMQAVKPKDVKRVKARSDLVLYTFLSRSYGYAGWNCEHWIFRDPEVRRAMTLAINRKNIVEALFYGYAQEAASPIISSMWACDRSIKPWPFDRAAAAKILAERGWTKGPDGVLVKDGKRFEFYISYNAGNEIREQIVQLARSDLREIGVLAKPRPLDSNVLSENLQKGEEEAWVWGWYVATKVDEKPTFHSSSIGGFNYCRWANPRIDQLIDTGRIEPDLEKARAIWKEFQAIFHREQPYTILYEPRSINVAHSRLKNVEMNSIDIYDNLPEWFIPKGLQK